MAHVTHRRGGVKVVTEAGRPYHHGDLRAALVGAGLELTRTGGPGALVLRDAARRAGVTPNAVYRHFADRQALLRAVADRVQADVAARMDGTPGAVDPVERLRAVGLGYVGLALAEPGWFQVAFGDLLPQPARPGERGPGLPAPLARLVQALDGLVDAGLLDPADRPGAEWPCWAAVHGCALLALHGPLRGQPREVVEAIAGRTVDTVVSGLLHRHRAG